MSSTPASPHPDSRLPAADRLVEAALALILENGGCRGVNLRQIAARVGCAHTNAYNYFNSLEDLFWAAVHRAVELQLADTVRQMQTSAAAADPLRTFLAAQVAFAQENPGLYRLFWLEALDGAPPLRVLERLGEARALWVRFLGGRLAALRSRTDPAWAGQIVHGYFHGEICKLIGRRAFVPQSTDDRDRIVANTLALVDLVATAAPR
jgi:AcrR family transcriptional regulator